ncbi:MAG TPA: type II toxin-antitoxin system VapC family toxin [Phycisphaerales bacterium]|nr:type II toxin-antitoxin system VapC family toxin [Phycisphaerales bacterium]
MISTLRSTSSGSTRIEAAARHARLPLDDPGPGPPERYGSGRALPRRQRTHAERGLLLGNGHQTRAGRLQFPGPFAQFIESQSAANRIDLLPISMAHLDSLVALPKPGGDHRDPFDRLLIAQALAERIPLVSGDGAMDAYGVARLW